MRKKWIIGAVCFLTAAITVCVFVKPIRYRLYPGDRITGTVQVTVNGQPVALSADDVSGCDKATALPDGSTVVRIRGGGYGNYTFNVVFSDDCAPLAVHCFQHNWWSVMRFDVTIDVSAESGACTCSGVCVTLDDSGKQQSQQILQTFRRDSESFDIQFGL